MLPRSERQPGVDLERCRAVGDVVAVRRGVDEEPPGADRFKSGLADRHPVVFAEMGQLGLATRGKAAQQDQLPRRRLLGEIGEEPPVVGRVRIGLIGNDHRR